MSVQTTQVGGPSADAQSPTGGPGAGEGKGTGTVSNAVDGGPDQSGQPKGNHSSSSGVSSPQNVGLAKVFAGKPGAGEGKGTGTASNAVDGGPDQSGIKPKGNSENTQSNDNLSLPNWAAQLPKSVTDRLTSDPDSLAKLSSFKGFGDLVEAFLDTSAKADGLLAVPGKDSAPEAVQAFYERLGKPKEAGGYSFAKNDPALAAAAFNANLSASQADAFYRASLIQLDDARKGMQASLVKDYQATDVLLQKEYGEKYGEAIALMQRGMGNNPATGELSPVAQALVNAGLAGKPEIVRAFIELGRATSEGTSPRGSMGAPAPESVLQGRGFAYKDNY